MAEKAKTTKRAPAKKSSAAKAAAELENVAVGTALEGAEDALDGLDDLDVARGAARIGVAEVGLAASDLTRAEDAALVAARVAQLSQVVGAAGEADIAQGAEMLATSEDIDVMAAVVGLMGEEDLERGLELARLSGELETVGEVMERMGMPVLAAFLADRGEILQDIAVEVVLRLGSTRALAQALAASGADIAALGRNEVGEGLVRIVAAEEAAAASDALAETSDELAERGVEGMMVAGAALGVAKKKARQGVAEIAEGAAELGAAAAEADIAEAVKSSKKK